MVESSDEFFEGKRLWSKIKDEVLEKYMRPYLAKVNTRGQPILLIDGYAGPGTFGDKTIGSPIIMCEAAEKYAKGNYQAIFDALILLNDIMTAAYFSGMHKADFSGGLWADTDWREMRSIEGLEQVVTALVGKHPGESRKSVWSRVVQENFMRYLEPEFNATVQRLVQQKKLTYFNPRGTNRLNEDCKLYLPKQ